MQSQARGVYQRQPAKQTLDEEKVTVKEQVIKNVVADEWDTFSMDCCGSYRSSMRYICVASLQFWRYKTVKLMEFYLTTQWGSVKIGQVVILVRGKTNVIEDGLLLLPDYQDHFTAAITALLNQNGDGEYHYGHTYSISPPRNEELASLRCITIKKTRNITVQYVNFSRWPCWDAYFSSTRKGVKTNVQQAKTLNPGLVMHKQSGISMLRNIYYFMSFRRNTYMSKAIQFSHLRIFASYFNRVICCGKLAFSAVASIKSERFASLSGISFGDNYYYLDAGRSLNSGNIQWFLLMEFMRTCYARSPSGKFIMGWVEYPKYDEGLLKSRQACRVSDHLTSIISFSVLQNQPLRLALNCPSSNKQTEV